MSCSSGSTPFAKVSALVYRYVSHLLKILKKVFHLSNENVFEYIREILRYRPDSWLGGLGKCCRLARERSLVRIPLASRKFVDLSTSLILDGPELNKKWGGSL